MHVCVQHWAQKPTWSEIQYDIKPSTVGFLLTATHTDAVQSQTKKLDEQSEAISQHIVLIDCIGNTI